MTELKIAFAFLHFSFDIIICLLIWGMPKDAHMSGATSHSGRRTFITKLADKGVGVRVLMALAGHKSIATTQRYIELNPTVMKAAVELI